MADITLSHRLFDQAVNEPEYVTTPESDAPQRNDDWETLVSKGIHLKDAEDATQWARGDLAALVDRRYGEGSIEKFAAETKLGAAKTLYEQATIADFFLPSTRTLNPELKFEHYRKAYRAVRKAKDKLEMPSVTALNWLERAGKEGWSAAKMGREIALALGQKARESWVFEPQDVVFVGGYTTLLMSEDEQKRVQKALAHKGKPSFKVTLRFSVELEPEV